MALLLAGIAINSLKNGMALPRPSHVDARLTEPGRGPAAPSIGEGSAASFWARLDPEVIADFRTRPRDSYGLPSGHVGSATAFFLALALFFRSRGVLLFAAAWIPLMAVSRMYLGRHYLADALAGFAVGVLAVALAAALLRPLAVERPSVRSLWPLASVGLLLLVLSPFLTHLDEGNVGRLLGLLGAWALILAAGAPPDGGTFGQRWARVATAVVVYVTADLVIDALWDAAGWEDTRLAAAAAAMLLTGAALAGTFEICRRLEWYHGAAGNDGAT